MLRTFRSRCCHNFRPSRLPGKASICVRCLCETIDELLENDSGSITPSTISEIIYNLRLINTSLDSNDQKMDAVLSEIEIRPIIDTFAGVLKIPNDEIGLMIAQGVQKICPRIAAGPREYLMKNIVNQLQKAQLLTLGTLECLRVLLLSEECLTLFLEKFGQEVFPKVFQTLRSTTAAWVEGRRFSQSDTTNSQIGSQSRSQSLMGTEAGSITKEENSKTVLVIYSIMERTFEVAKKETNSSLDYFGSSSSGVDINQIFVPHIRDVIVDSIAQLKENQKMPVVSKVLGFLTKLLQHELALLTLLQTNNGVALCSIVKRMLFGHNSVIQKQTISMLISMFSTYETALEVPGEHQRHIVDLPTLMQQVDLLHAISQAMNTSDPDLFRLILQLLKRWIDIPFFKGKMTAIVETGLRIVPLVIDSESHGVGKMHSFFLNVLQTMENIPVCMQNQIISLYNKLPCNWKPMKYLQWAKLLLHCSDINFRPFLINFRDSALQYLKDDPCSVTCLKLVLALSQAVLNCNISSDSNNTESQDMEEEIIRVNKLVIELLSIPCIPSVMALAKFGRNFDSIYVTILLQMLQAYPLELLVPSCSRDVSESFQIFAVEHENEEEDEDDVSTSGITMQEIPLFAKGLYSKEGIWSSGAYMKILAWIRSNMELLKYKRVFDLWNRNMARIVRETFSIYLSPLACVWQPLVSYADSEEDVSRFLIDTFQYLELDNYKWTEMIGANIFENSEVNVDLKIQQEAILTFYYFYFLFNMNDNERLLAPSFIQSLSFLLEQRLQNKICLSPGLELESLSFYFKASLLIVSCLTETASLNLIEQFETFILDVDEAMPNFELVVTFCGPVFNLLLRWNILPMKEITKLLEKWAQDNWDEFQLFFKTMKLDDGQEDGTLRNHIVAITSYGSIEISNLMVGIVKERQIQSSSNFDPGLLQSTLADLINEILQDDSSNQMSNRTLNFSNLLSLALGDDPMFCQERVIPSEFFGDVINILVKHQNLESLSETCLSFLLKFLSSVDSPGYVQSICLSNDFIQFLSHRLELKKGCPIISSVAFKLMAIVVNLIDTQEDRAELRRLGIAKVRWSISSLIPYIQFSRRISYLELICALLKKDFNRSIIMVREKKLKRAEFINLLMNLQFHAQSLCHKDMDENADLVWKFHYELLRYSERGLFGRPFSASVLMHPWNNLIICTGVLTKTSPFDLSIDCLRFLAKWARHFSILMNDNPELFPLDYQVFSFINHFYHLREKIRAVAFEESMEAETESQTAGTDEYSSSVDSVKQNYVNKILAACNSFVSRVPLEVLMQREQDSSQKEDSFCFEDSLSQTSVISINSGSETCSSCDLESDFESNLLPMA